MRSGFTLIEVLAVVAVLSVLLAVTIPSLKGAKQAADNAANLAAIRQFGTALTMYTHQADLRYPFFGVPGYPEKGLRFGTCRVGEFSSQGAMAFVNQSQYWVSGIIPFLSGWQSLPWESRIDQDGYISEMCGSGYEHTGMFWSPVRITHAVFAEPEFFTDDGPHTGSMINGTRSTQVRHPGRKGLLIGIPSRRGSGPSALPESHPIRIGFADGSVSMKPWIIRSFDPKPRPRFVFIDYWPIMTTRDGLKGVDY